MNRPIESEVTIQYHYTGDFADTPDNAATAETMFNAGVEVILAAGGAVGSGLGTALGRALGGESVLGQGGLGEIGLDALLGGAFSGFGKAAKAAKAGQAALKIGGKELGMQTVKGITEGAGVATGKEALQKAKLFVASHGLVNHMVAYSKSALGYELSNDETRLSNAIPSK